MFRRSFTALAASAVGLSIAVASEVAAQDAVALAIAPIPSPAEQATAKVIRKQGDEWVTLREGAGPFICVADDPAVDGFHSACYHTSLEPYMARGRELTAQGTTGRPNVEQRMAEIEAGTLEMPSYAFLHAIYATEGWSGDMEAVQRHQAVIYTPFATAEDLGLPTRATRGAWLMAAGTANAHVMITP
ncbi:MAG: hypothetical protein F4164_09160 [Gemmatimonadales bacterium]|nr:hypothetical protein [Gemmatimonadales bacterium]MYG49515.1 hypothetical protein [Gemmatimonadales bacterium]MYK01663.1 hypothetical protein [Candidatus Palauibacter ramosifaciens]